MAALFVAVAVGGCPFQPGELTPPDKNPVDSGSPAPDSSAPVDASSAPDSMLPVDVPPDAPLPPAIDARPSNQRRKRITIPAARVEAPAGPGFLSDFPVLFAVTDTQIRDRAEQDGSDIYFTAANGTTRLDHEIERWNFSTGELIAWVKIPQLSGSQDNVFYIYYGDPAQAQPVEPREVWTNDFAAVWHLAQDPGPGGTGDIVDSTTGNDGTAHSSMAGNDLVTAQIANGLDFDGNDDEITFNNPLSGGTPHTISAWVNQRSSNNDDAVVVLGTGMFNQARWLYSVRSGGDVAFGFYTNDHVSGANVENDGWRLLHWTYDGNTSRLYINGAQQGGEIQSGNVNTQGSAGRMGNAPSTAFGTNIHLDGRLDEVRIATAVRPPEWIVTEYNNQLDPSMFYDIGGEEP